MKSVCILGCGPAGLLGAYAAELQGADVTIMSEPNKSKIGGAMYLHRSIPAITEEQPDAWIWIEKRGTAEGYAEKVYGNPSHPVSFTQWETGGHPMWSLRDAYDALWELYQAAINPYRVHPEDICEICNSFDLVVSTIPAPVICKSGHRFAGAPIWITMSETIRRLPLDLKQTMIYSGDPQDDWYRYSLIDGVRSWEYAKKPPDQKGALKGQKVIDTDCDCHSELDNFMKAGRWGMWKRGVLSHHVYDQVSYALQ